MFYKVLKSDSLENLENQVNEYINNGFLLQGGIYVDTVFIGKPLVTLHGGPSERGTGGPADIRTPSPGELLDRDASSWLSGDITLNIRSTYYQAVSKTPPNIFKVKEAPIVD